MKTTAIVRLGMLAALAPATLPAQLAVHSPPPRTAPNPSTVHTTTSTPGAGYAAGRLHRTLLGDGYRELWQTPVAVEVLDMARFADGLTPTRTGGDFSTKALRLRGADGREYVFRSLDKDATQGLHPDLRNTLADRVVQDQVSVALPAGVLVASALQSAAGILHAPPRLVVMPDDARLGEFRGEFAGVLGTIEERPGDADEGPAFEGAARVASSVTMLERLKEGPRHRVDSHAYLSARLLDLVMGDWDRHDDQWRWARYDAPDGTHLWRPIARDRDNAFAMHDGVLLNVARSRMPKLVAFGETYPAIGALTESAQLLDRQILSDLPRAAWDFAAADVRARLTDEVIDEAVRRLPPEHHAIVGARIAAALRARRDALPQATEAFYRQLAQVVDLHGTDAAETVRVQRLADGGVEVRMASFRRRFTPGETREVRLHLYGGDDDVRVEGEAQDGPLVRVVGGAGDDVMVDASRVRAGRRTVFHDSEGSNRIDAGAGATVDARPYTPPAPGPRLDNLPAERDRGAGRSLEPWVGYSNAGVLVGGSMTWTRYGFRRAPFASRDALRLEVAPMDAGAALDWRRTQHASDGTMLTVHARASQIDRFRFHGLGNDTDGSGARDAYLVAQDVVSVEAEVSRPVAGLRVGVGPVLRWRDASPDAGTPFALAAPLGSDAYATGGLRTTLYWDRRDAPAFPRRGGWVLLTGEAHQGLSGQVDGSFARTRGEGAAYLPMLGAATLAVRAGGERVWGSFPVQEAAFLGGTGSLRGDPRARFAGDAAVWGNAELRSSLGRANLRVVRGDAGALLLMDAGRVYVDGDSPGGWHTSYGGGLYFSAFDNAWTTTLLAAHGEDGWRATLRMGLPF
ncbi:BamA/TamA family outer membrane protein [Longimicrobium sp.]|uniref:BamA/TamA family outer membrane protein n=1 Tax=Longimicrobium sp. TaxID=2029185 RepID=UPI003B3B2C58